eukprot:17205_1
MLCILLSIIFTIFLNGCVSRKFEAALPGVRYDIDISSEYTTIQFTITDGSYFRSTYYAIGFGQTDMGCCAYAITFDSINWLKERTLARFGIGRELKPITWEIIHYDDSDQDNIILIVKRSNHGRSYQFDPDTSVLEAIYSKGQVMGDNLWRRHSNRHGSELFALPTREPTNKPTNKPTDKPTLGPTQKPTAKPTENPTPKPTENPTPKQTEYPTDGPTDRPTTNPTDGPTDRPTANPTDGPTKKPTQNPIDPPTPNPSSNPSDEPTESPSNKPSEYPSESPTRKPTEYPSESPTKKPTEQPTDYPTVRPTHAPSEQPTDEPTAPQHEVIAPSSKSPTMSDEPTDQPTASPITPNPTTPFPTTPFPTTSNPTAAAGPPFVPEFKSCITSTTVIGNGDNEISISMQINMEEETMLIKIIGPSKYWFGVGFGTQRMEGTYAITVEDDENDEFIVAERILGNWQLMGDIISITNVDTYDLIKTTVDGKRLITFKRPWYDSKTFNFYHLFRCHVDEINIISAYGYGPNIAYHNQRSNDAVLTGCGCHDNGHGNGDEMAEDASAHSGVHLNVAQTFNDEKVINSIDYNKLSFYLIVVIIALNIIAVTICWMRTAKKNDKKIVE